MQTGTRSAYDFGIMRSKNRFLFVLLAALALSVGLAVDALTVSDKDRLGRFIDELIERPSDDRVGAALRYSDPLREELELVYGGSRRSVDAKSASRLAHELSRALDALSASELKLVQRAIEIDGESARVAIRVAAGDELVNYLFHFRKHEADWLIRRVAVTT